MSIPATAAITARRTLACASSRLLWASDRSPDRIAANCARMSSIRRLPAPVATSRSARAGEVRRAVTTGSTHWCRYASMSANSGSSSALTSLSATSVRIVRSSSGICARAATSGSRKSSRPVMTNPRTAVSQSTTPFSRSETVCTAPRTWFVRWLASLADRTAPISSPKTAIWSTPNTTPATTSWRVRLRGCSSARGHRGRS